jgi:hypothetical protein
MIMTLLAIAYEARISNLFALNPEKYITSMRICQARLCEAITAKQIPTDPKWG